MITIIDYGLGNVSAFSNMYRRMSIDARVAKNASELEGATRVILPGVGAFDHALTLLDASGMRPALTDLVTEHRVPLLGVCVGMQILAKSSDEGRSPGLGWIPGKVRSFRSLANWSKLPLPHMGWNDIEPVRDEPLFDGLPKDARFYFLHSFFFDCENSHHSAATANYGIDFSCAIHADNIYGVQFHPEKSHSCGAALLKSFAQC